jgi:hypothetical protein
MRFERSWRLGATLLFVVTANVGTVQAETCGIDSIFANSFESVAPGGSVDGTPGALQSPGITQSIVGPPGFSIAITYPAPGSTIAGSSTAIVGTFNGPTNTGVVINGVRGYVVDNQFFAPAVPVDIAGTALDAIGTKLTGETATSTVNVIGGASVPVKLIVGRSAGFSPFRAVFTYSIGALPGGAGVQYIGIDYNADGTDDVVNPPLGTTLASIATISGVYHARLTVQDTNSVTYISDAYYAVRSASELSGMLCDVYGYMKQRLGQPSPDIPGALNAVLASARDEFEGMFTDGSGSLPSYVGNLGSIVSGAIGEDFGSYLVVRLNPDQTLSGYPMEFSQDATGVWRISDM